MSVQYEFQHDRAGDTAKLTVSFQVQDRHGPMGAAGVGSSGGWLDGEIDSDGKLTAVGGGEYRAPAARPGVDPTSPEVRLTVRRAGTPISSVVFRPVLASAEATTLNVNDLLRSGRAVAATPEQLVSLSAALADTRAAIEESRQVNADTAQARADLKAQQDANNTQQTANAAQQTLNNTQAQQAAGVIGYANAMLAGAETSTDEYIEVVQDTATGYATYALHRSGVLTAMEVNTPYEQPLSGNTLDAVEVWTDADGWIMRYRTSDGTLHDVTEAQGAPPPATASAAPVPVALIDGGNLYRREGTESVALTTSGDVGQIVSVDAGRITYTRGGGTHTVRADANGKSARLDPRNATINHVISSGQSLSVGTRSTPALSTSQPYSNLMFADGVRSEGNAASLVPLVEVNETDPSFDGAPTGETPWSGMANSVTARVLADNPRARYAMLMSVHGVGGTPISGLSKGTRAYNRSLDAVRQGRALAQARGDTYALRAITWVHGEANSGSENYDYYTALKTLHADYITDTAAILGAGTPPLVMLLCQMNMGQSLTVAEDQLRYTEEANTAYLVGPKYHLLRAVAGYNDIVHLDPVGGRHLGEYYGKVYRCVVLDGKPWRPLSPREIWTDGGSVFVRLYVPSGPLVMDRSIGAMPADMAQTARVQEGFELIDGSGSIPLTVQIVSGDTLRLTPSRLPGADARLHYALQAGPRGGTIRDSDPTPSLYGNNLANWLTAFRKPLTWRAY